MPDHVYRIIQVAGSSEKSIEDAIQNAVGRASRTLRQVGWFEVLETRGHVEDGKVAHYQDIAPTDSLRRDAVSVPTAKFRSATGSVSPGIR